MKLKYLKLSKKLISIILISGCGLLPVCGHAEDFEYTQAKIYFGGWNIGSERRFSSDWMRLNYQEYFYFRDPSYVKSFVESSLELLKLQKVNNTKINSSMLPWLVIDLYVRDKKAATYFSDGCYLFSEDGAYFRPVTNKFRERFTLFIETQVSSSLTKTLTLDCAGN